MRANDFRPSDPVRYGAYLCIRVPAEARATAAAAEVDALTRRLGLTSEFEAAGGHPAEAVAFVRRIDATPASIDDDGLLRADAIVHVALPQEAGVRAFITGLSELLGPAVGLRVLGGVVRPTNFTGNLMHNFAYAHQVIQQPGRAMPNAFLLPMSKTAEWWAKDWMERHTYFLPRYDEAGRVTHAGHVQSAAAGIASLMRRTYKASTEPAPQGTYDFVNYFECADADVQTFHVVCASLRDVAKNPEWAFVREGPLWHGRRVETWQALFA